MSLKRIISLTLWAGMSGASCLALLAGCGGDDLRCGDGTLEQQNVCVPASGEPSPSAKDTSLTITSLDVPEGPMHENHPMKARVGIKGTGDGEHFTISLGLMESPPTQGELPASLSHCLLAGTHIYVQGGDKEQFIDLDFTVGTECHQGKNHNFFISYASEEHPGQLTGQTTVFSARDAQKEQNRRCLKPSGEAGCVYDVELQESPGLDVHVTGITPSSKVAIAYPAAPGEHAHPLLTVGTDIALHGRDRSGSAEVQGAPLYLAYSIAPAQGNTTDWQPLDLDDTQDGTVTTHYPIPRLPSHEPLHVSNHLHATQSVQSKLQGDWSRQNVFNLRACVESSFEQEGGGTHTGGENGTGNDCQVITVQLVRAASNAAPQQASTQSWSYNWSQTYGGDKISLTPSFSTTNVIDLTGSQIPQANGQLQQGAMASVNGQAKLGGQYVGDLGKTPLFQGSAQAVAYVAVQNSFATASVDAFGYNLYTFNEKASFADPLFDKDLSWEKQLCQSSTYVVFAIPVTLKFCGSGTIGLQGQLNLGNSGVPGQTGQGGQVQATVTPYASLKASAEAAAGVPGFSVGVEGRLTLIEVRAPLNTTLNWGLGNLSPLALNISGYAAWDLQINTLSGEISLVLTYPSVNWCPGWWDVEYPCGPWTGTYSDPLYAFDGLTWNQPLLNVTQPMITLSR